MTRSPFPSLFARLRSSDEQLMEQFRDGRDAALARLIDRWEGPIGRQCWRMVGDSHCAEDLTQEVFIRLCRNRHAYRQTGSFSSYIRRIAMNVCRDELRRRRRRDELGDGNLEGHCGVESQPETEAAAREQAARVRAALDTLPEMYRAVLVLRHYEQLKLREVADVLGIPQGTVNSRMAEALTRLERLLGPSVPDHSPDPALSVCLPEVQT